MYMGSVNTVSSIRVSYPTRVLANIRQTVATLWTFILAMTLYPEVQCKAQAEIDHVVGIERLPVFSDEEELPYVQAVLKEVFRWHPIAPLCMFCDES